MKKLKEFWLGVPRPLRTFVNLMVTFALLVTFYVCIGSPTLHNTQAFRRKERANLLGPSTILFNERVENYTYGHLILAETDNCVITWVDDITWGFNYHEKTGDMTLVTGPKWWFDYGLENWEVCLPVFLLDDYPEAVYADMELHIQGTYIHSLNGDRLEETLDHSFYLSASRDEDGYFYFPLSLPYVDEFDSSGNPTGVTHGDTGYAVDALALTFTNVRKISRPQSEVTVTATVGLYDEQENLVAERELVVCTLIAEP